MPLNAPRRKKSGVIIRESICDQEDWSIAFTFAAELEVLQKMQVAIRQASLGMRAEINDKNALVVTRALVEKPAEWKEWSEQRAQFLKRIIELTHGVAPIDLGLRVTPQLDHWPVSPGRLSRKDAPYEMAVLVSLNQQSPHNSPDLREVVLEAVQAILKEKFPSEAAYVGMYHALRETRAVTVKTPYRDEGETKALLHGQALAKQVGGYLRELGILNTGPDLQPG